MPAWNRLAPKISGGWLMRWPRWLSNAPWNRPAHQPNSVGRSFCRPSGRRLTPMIETTGTPIDALPKRVSRPSFNIGIEEEYQTIDPITRDLRSHIHAEILEQGKRLLAERIKPEMHQSVVEIGTGVCRNIKEA